MDLEDSDNESDNEVWIPGGFQQNVLTMEDAALRLLTRAEEKAQDRELPWRVIWERGEDCIQKFRESVVKEADKWERWNSLRPLSEEESTKILKDPDTRKYVLKS
eukprot:1212841-Lingulodinium_polyedra.AAC.1